MEEQRELVLGVSRHTLKRQKLNMEQGLSFPFVPNLTILTGDPSSSGAKNVLRKNYFSGRKNFLQ